MTRRLGARHGLLGTSEPLRRSTPWLTTVLLGCIVYATLILLRIPLWLLLTVGIGLLAGPLLAAASLRQLRRRTYIVPIEPPLPPRDFQGREDEITRIFEII